MPEVKIVMLSQLRAPSSDQPALCNLSVLFGN